MTRFVICADVPADEPEYAYDWLQGALDSIVSNEGEAGTPECPQPLPSFQVFEVEVV